MIYRMALSRWYELRRRLPVPGALAPVTTRAPFVRESLSVPAAMLLIVAATVPAWLAGIWFIGAQLLEAAGPDVASTLTPWRAALLEALPESAGPAALGLSYFLPLLLTTLVIGSLWEYLFARFRDRPLDCGIFYTAWLFTLMLPAGASPATVAVGASFAFVVGKLLFGGTGRYLVSPPLLGIVFLQFAYPATPDPVQTFPVAGAAGEPVMTTALTGGLEALAEAGVSLGAVALGDDLGAFGTTSAIACAFGALLLMLGGLVSWRIIAAVLVGSLLMTLALNAWGPEDPAFDLTWRWHLATGSFAFLVAFIATDPSGAAVTRAGRWIYGFLIGAAAILFRVANTSHPEGTFYAVLLVSLAAPAIDHAVIAWQLRRHRRRFRS
jgi:Na+-transporting NADH:ubiquinone oxidoreductase subunit B